MCQKSGSRSGAKPWQASREAKDARPAWPSTSSTNTPDSEPSLRHTFLTRQGQVGRVALLWTRARIAGHSSITISARYVHPSEDAVLLAVEKLDRRKIGHSEKSASETANDETLLSA